MSRRIRYALIGVGILVVGLVVFFLLINPIRGDIGSLHSQIQDEDSRIANANSQLKEAEQTRNEGRRNQARLLELAKMMPQDAEVPSLILQIQDLADKAGIDWIQVSPGEVRAVEGLTYEVLPLTLNFSGSFYDVSDFVYRAEQMVAGPGRLLVVKDMSLAPQTIKGGGTVPLSVILGVQITVWAYVLPASAATTGTTPGSTTGTTSSGGAGTATTKAPSQ